MGKKPQGAAALTNTEKQKRYRERYNAYRDRLKVLETELEALKAVAQAPDGGALRESIKQELKKSWEPELKAERMAAQRKLGRELARKEDQSRAQGRTAGICDVAAFFIGKDRVDIAQSILARFSIDRESAAAVLEADKRTRNMTLESLDKSGAWKAPPPVIK